MPKQWIARTAGLIVAPQQRLQIHRATGIGLGDIVHIFLWCVGIDWLWKKIAEKLRRPCGCQRRQAWLNQIRFYVPVRFVTNKNKVPQLIADGGEPVRPDQLKNVAKSMLPN